MKNLKRILSYLENFNKITHESFLILNNFQENIFAPKPVISERIVMNTMEIEEMKTLFVDLTN